MNIYFYSQGIIISMNETFENYYLSTDKSRKFYSTIKKRQETKIYNNRNKEWELSGAIPSVWISANRIVEQCWRIYERGDANGWLIGRLSTYTLAWTNVIPHFGHRRIQMAVAHVINLIDVASRAPYAGVHACAAALDIRAWVVAPTVFIN